MIDYNKLLGVADNVMFRPPTEDDRGGLFVDPNMQKMLMSIGANISKGLPFAEAISGPGIDMLQSRQAQDTGAKFFDMLMNRFGQNDLTEDGKIGGTQRTVTEKPNGEIVYTEKGNRMNQNPAKPETPMESMPASKQTFNNDASLGGMTSPFVRSLLG